MIWKKKQTPKEGSVKTVNGIHYAYRGSKWVKMSATAQAQINKNQALNRANVGGTTKLLKNQNKPTNRSNVIAKNNNQSKGGGAANAATIKGSNTSKTKSSDSEKAAWLKKTRNSPAAKAGFSDDHRWELQQKHRKWKADRKAKSEAKKKGPVSKGPAPKLDTQQKTQLKKENKVNLKIEQIPKGKVKMKDGRIVDRSSLYKKKKKPLGSRLAANFD